MAERVKTLVYDDCVVRVHFPDVSEEEHAIQQKKLEKATERFLRAVERANVERKKLKTG